MVTVEHTKRTLLPGDPDAPFRVPLEEQFGGMDFMPAPELEEVGEAILRRKLTHLDGEITVEYRWKKKGGTSKGREVLGRCVPLTGLVRHFANGSDFVVWIAADTARAYKMTRWQMEAAVYHELSHIARIEEEDDDGPTGDVSFKGRGHDVEMFYMEVQEYGLWTRDLERAAETFEQLRLLETQ